MNYPISPCGDCAVTIQIGSQISLEVHQAVTLAMDGLEKAHISGVVELVPAYASVCVHYNPLVIDFDTLIEQIKSIPLPENSSGAFSHRCWKEIPVCYGGEYGPDLSFVARHCGLSEEEVIQRHSQGQYLVYMLGFLPGFAYLGGMDEKIACPRLSVPRTKIPPGSVGIAGEQTGIYPLASPGGWQLIGRTPIQMFSPAGEKGNFFLSAGDWVRFVPVSLDEYHKMEKPL